MIITSSVQGIQLSATPSGGTFSNSLSVETVGPVAMVGGGLQWLMTSPILGPDARAQGVVVGDLDLAVLARLLNPYGADAVASPDQEVHVLNAAHQVVFSSDWGAADDDSGMLGKGALRLTGESAIYDHAITAGA